MNENRRKVNQNILVDIQRRKISDSILAFLATKIKIFIF